MPISVPLSISICIYLSIPTLISLGKKKGHRVASGRTDRVTKAQAWEDGGKDFPFLATSLRNNFQVYTLNVFIYWQMCNCNEVGWSRDC